MTLTRPECTHIMAPIRAAGLPAQCVNRNLPDAVLYGPASLQGFRMVDLYVHQGTSRIAYI